MLLLYTLLSCRRGRKSLKIKNALRALVPGVLVARTDAVVRPRILCIYTYYILLNIVRERRARIDECLMTIFGYTEEEKSAGNRCLLSLRCKYIYIYIYVVGDIILLFVSTRPRVIHIYIYIYNFFHFMQTSKANDRRRQTDRQTD
jgi:hypothetical protein